MASVSPLCPAVKQLGDELKTTLGELTAAYADEPTRQVIFTPRLVGQSIGGKFVWRLLPCWRNKLK